jgi:4-hydroxy-2-oxoheptanedioate aldolase
MAGSLKSRLAAGERLVVFSVGRMFHPNVIRYLGMRGDFDGFWIDVEHAGLTVEHIEQATSAGLGFGLEAFVRIPPTDYATVTRCYESGAVGVMAAQVRDAAHAEEIVGWAKFAPRGRRGMNPLGFDGGYGTLPLADFAATANEQTMVGIQIETATALDEVEEIAAIDDVDFLFVGPSDLSQALGVTGAYTDPVCLAAIDRIAAACEAGGKPWGAVTPDPEYAALVVEKGCTLVSPTNDVRLVSSGLAAVKDRFADVWTS